MIVMNLTPWRYLLICYYVTIWRSTEILILTAGDGLIYIWLWINMVRSHGPLTRWCWKYINSTNSLTKVLAQSFVQIDSTCKHVSFEVNREKAATKPSASTGAGSNNDTVTWPHTSARQEGNWNLTEWTDQNEESSRYTGHRSQTSTLDVVQLWVSLKRNISVQLPLIYKLMMSRWYSSAYVFLFIYIFALCVLLVLFSIVQEKEEWRKHHYILPKPPYDSHSSFNIEYIFGICAKINMKILLHQLIEYSDSYFFTDQWTHVSAALGILNSLSCLPLPLCLFSPLLTSVNSGSCAYCGKILLRWQTTCRFLWIPSELIYTEYTGCMGAQADTNKHTVKNLDDRWSLTTEERVFFLGWTDPSWPGKWSELSEREPAENRCRLEQLP